MDGTLVFRGRALNYPTDQLPPNSMNATDTGYGSYFEGRPVYFNMFRQNYPVWFRHGTFKFLEILSESGKNTIYLATHACKQYAERIASFLCDRIRNLRLIVLTFRKQPLELKHVSFSYEFILEDKPERWIRGTEHIIRIPSFDNTTSAEDYVLLGYVAIFKETFRLLPEDIMRRIAEYAGGETGFEMLRRCARCRRWVLVEEACDECGLNTGSDTDVNDSFETSSLDS